MIKYIFILVLFSGCKSYFYSTTNNGNMKEMKINWDDHSKPGKYHALLNALTGEWNFIGKYWPEGPGKPAATDEGIASAKWVNDGRFVQLEGSGTQMQMPFSFISLIGYSNIRQVYTSVWSDNSSTAFFIAKGVLNSQTNQINFLGLSDDPMEKVTDKMWKVVLSIESDQHFRFDYFDVSGDQELKLFVLDFQKKA